MPTPFNDQWRLPRWQDSRRLSEHTALKLSRARTEPFSDQDHDDIRDASSKDYMPHVRKARTAGLIAAEARRRLP